MVMKIHTTQSGYGGKVDAALDAITPLLLTEADFIDLAMACLDQGGLSRQGQDVVRKAIGLDPLREGDDPS